MGDAASEIVRSRHKVWVPAPQEPISSPVVNHLHLFRLWHRESLLIVRCCCHAARLTPVPWQLGHASALGLADSGETSLRPEPRQVGHLWCLSASSFLSASTYRPIKTSASTTRAKPSRTNTSRDVCIAPPKPWRPYYLNQIKRTLRPVLLGRAPVLRLSVLCSNKLLDRLFSEPGSMVAQGRSQV